MRRRLIDFALSIALLTGIVLALASLDPRLHGQLGAVIAGPDAARSWYSGIAELSQTVFDTLHEIVAGQTSLVVFGTAGVIVLLLLLRT